MSVPNFHVLRVKYLSPTNYRGSRVKIISDRFKQSVTIPYDHALNNPEDMAVAYLQNKCQECKAYMPDRDSDDCQAFNIVGMAEGYVITDTFQPLKKA